eukprot:1275052-Amorphochlora_amoeboformis.AAC.1
MQNIAQSNCAASFLVYRTERTKSRRWHGARGRFNPPCPTSCQAQSRKENAQEPTGYTSSSCNGRSHCGTGEHSTGCLLDRLDSDASLLVHDLDITK